MKEKKVIRLEPKAIGTEMYRSASDLIQQISPITLNTKKGKRPWVLLSTYFCIRLYVRPMGIEI